MKEKSDKEGEFNENDIINQHSWYYNSEKDEYVIVSEDPFNKDIVFEVHKENNKNIVWLEDTLLGVFARKDEMTNFFNSISNDNSIKRLTSLLDTIKDPDKFQNILEEIKRLIKDFRRQTENEIKYIQELDDRYGYY